jgi:hypothetical protein
MDAPIVQHGGEGQFTHLSEPARPGLLSPDRPERRRPHPVRSRDLAKSTHRRDLVSGVVRWAPSSPAFAAECAAPAVRDARAGDSRGLCQEKATALSSTARSHRSFFLSQCRITQHSAPARVKLHLDEKLFSSAPSPQDADTIVGFRG